MRRVLRFLHSDDGATAIEYAVLAGLVLLAAVTALMLYAQSTALR